VRFQRGRKQHEVAFRRLFHSSVATARTQENPTKTAISRDCPKLRHVLRTKIKKKVAKAVDTKVFFLFIPSSLRGTECFAPYGAATSTIERKAQRGSPVTALFSSGDPYRDGCDRFCWLGSLTLLFEERETQAAESWRVVFGATWTTTNRLWRILRFSHHHDGSVPGAT
jgi:hypothetical protein